VDEIVAPLERAVHALGLRLSSPGITQAEAHVLARLADGPASIGDLHRSFGHKRSTLTAVVDRLETKGYVARAANPDDRRSVVVTLTPAGRPASRRARRAVRELERAVAAACSPRDLAGFTRVVGFVASLAGSKEEAVTAAHHAPSR
jgi:MarR family transcriptional regulator, organic hydroperoxide resistance regulator